MGEWVVRPNIFLLNTLVQVIIQPIFETVNEDVLQPVTELACQVTELLSVLCHHPAALMHSFDMVPRFAVGWGVFEMPRAIMKQSVSQLQCFHIVECHYPVGCDLFQCQD